MMTLTQKFLPVHNSKEMNSNTDKDLDQKMFVPSCFSCVQFFAILWTVAHQLPLSMGFSRQEYWSGLPCPSPGDLPKPGIEPASLMFPGLAGRFLVPLGPPRKPKKCLP